MQSSRFVLIFYWSLIACMIALTGLLFFEWYSFKQQKELMIVLQNDYRRYLEELQRQYQSEDNEEEDGQLPFTVVNREFEYLRDSALSFAKIYNLEDAVQTMYGQTMGDVGRQSPARGRRTAPCNQKRQMRPLLAQKHVATDFVTQWPLNKNSFWLSSRFGPRRKRDGSWGFHYGLDMAALKGTDVYAVADGIVTEAAYSPHGYGKYLIITHNKKYKTRYAHLDTMSVKRGQHVKAGALIGRVGATGLVRGKNASHLHFEVMVFGKHINPLYILS